MFQPQSQLEKKKKFRLQYWNFSRQLKKGNLNVLSIEDGWKEGGGTENKHLIKMSERKI